MLKWVIIVVSMGVTIGFLSCQFNLQDKIVKDNQQSVIQSQSIKRRNIMSTFSQNQVFLSFIIHNIQDDKLEIEYSFSNQSERGVYIFNQLYDTDSIGNATINPNRVYVFIEDDNTIVLAKKVIAVPEGVLVEYAEVPFVSFIQAGEIFSERITLPLPLKLYHPYIYYLEDPLSGGQVKNFKYIRFELGILPESDDIRFAERGTLRNGTKFLRPYYGQSLQKQIILSSEKLSVSIPVIGK